MKESTFTISMAFRLRNKLKARIKELKNVLDADESNLPLWKKRYLVQEGKKLTIPAKKIYPETNEEWALEYAGMEYNEAIGKVDALMTSLHDLNLAIDKANMINKPTLISLETTISKLAFYKKILENCRKVEPFIYENDSNGVSLRIKQESLADKKELENTIKKLQKQKDEFEESLMKINAATPVEFDWKAAEKLL